MKRKAHKRSRFLYLHVDVNSSKVGALDALQEHYAEFLKICVDLMIQERRFDIPQPERQSFFPRSKTLSSQIVKNVRAHAVGIVSGWAASKYTNTLRSYIRTLSRVPLIDESMRKCLCTIGKHGIDELRGDITQQALNLYWQLLLDEGVSGRRPTVSTRCGMMMSEMTCKLSQSEDTKLTRWWIAFSHLDAGKARIVLPLASNPYVTRPDQVSKGVLARRTKKGRWRFEVVEKRDWTPPVVERSMPRIGIDVGLNVMAASSDGRLLGRELKPKFNRARTTLVNARANRQRQGFDSDSFRLQRLEEKLTGLVRSMAGKVANDLVKAYPGVAFVLEDLDLRGSRGQKRMAYRALHHSLMRKAPCIQVNPAYTSQTCPSCGYVARANRRSTVFVCKFCGRSSHADVVGAVNLLRRSEDKEIACVDHPSEVKSILNARHEAWRSRHASLCASGRRLHAPALQGRRLTTRVPRGTGKAANQVPISTA